MWKCYGGERCDVSTKCGISQICECAAKENVANQEIAIRIRAMIQRNDDSVLLRVGQLAKIVETADTK